MQSVQRRLGKMRGEGRSNEEGVEQEAKIKQLTAELDQKTAVHNHLNEQIKRVNVRTHRPPHQKHSSLYLTSSHSLSHALLHLSTLSSIN